MDELSKLLEKDNDYSMKYNHYVYHYAHPESLEEDAVEYAKKSIEHYLQN